MIPKYESAHRAIQRDALTNAYSFAIRGTSILPVQEHFWVVNPVGVPPSEDWRSDWRRYSNLIRYPSVPLRARDRPVTSRCQFTVPGRGPGVNERAVEKRAGGLS